MDAEGNRLADKYNLIYNGWWKDPVNKFTFTEKKTKSTFIASDEEELRSTLNDMLLRYNEEPLASD